MKVGIHCGAKKKYLDSRRVESSTRFRENDKLSQHRLLLLYVININFVTEIVGGDVHKPVGQFPHHYTILRSATYHITNQQIPTIYNLIIEE